MNLLQKIRKPLLDEAINSPQLFADVAGLEEYIAESYACRSLIELLQNADDAEATRFVTGRFKNAFFVANDGRPFSQTDFTSLCRSSVSTKQRGKSIGYRGIGFKSVVAFASRIHIVSGKLRATFCRSLTKSVVPNSTKVPLVRVPHEIPADTLTRFEGLFQSLEAEGWTTIFLFEDLDDHAIVSEFETIKPELLLFLRHVEVLEVRNEIANAKKYEMSREQTDVNSLSCRLRSGDSFENWSVYRPGGELLSIAAKLDASIYVPLNSEEAVVYAFLPTHEEVGLGIKANGDVSTDPSRTRIVLDDRSLHFAAQLAGCVVQLLEEAIANPSPKANSLIDALSPISDPKLAGLGRKSLKSALFDEIHKQSTAKFSAVFRRPHWLNPETFVKLAEAARLSFVPPQLEKSRRFGYLCNLLGIEEADDSKICGNLNEVELDEHEALELIIRFATLQMTGKLRFAHSIGEWPLWKVNNLLTSLNEAVKANARIDEEFAKNWSSKIGGALIAHGVLKAWTSPSHAEHLLRELVQKGNNTLGGADQKSNTSAKHSTSVRGLLRWRSAEQQVAQVLTSDGFEVVDVSRQNLGYDLQATDSSGTCLFVEVKSITHIGESFKMTNNEQGVARLEGERYCIALVLQDDDGILLQMIRDPMSILSFERQCAQWVWVCDNYDFNPRHVSSN